MDDFEFQASETHSAWFREHWIKGIMSVKAVDSGEELMTPYESLSEGAKTIFRRMAQEKQSFTAGK